MSTPSPIDAGLINIKSQQSVQLTADAIVGIVEAKGMQVVARVDHAAAARKVEQTLRPTQLILFGNPQAGTPLMQQAQTFGLDLPQKMLVWEDEDKQTWITYNAMDFLAKRHQIIDLENLLGKIAGALESIAVEASN